MMDTFSDVYNRTLFGVPTYQGWADLHVWELFLNQCADIKLIIELGTGNGGLAVFLRAQATQRGMRFVTFDTQRYKDVLSIGNAYVIEDILQSHPPILMSLLNSKNAYRPLVLYCDNGHKTKEFNKYAPLIKPYDYIGVHDWGAEIASTEAEPSLHLLYPIMHKESEEVHSRTRFWRRRDVQVPD
jgi:cephalosporin hydroxylase